MSLVEKDLAYIWHPYTQMKGMATPIPIVKGEGAWLITEDGTRILDAIASWWLNTHGHSHPYIAEKVAEQLHTLEHVIFAGFTHPKAVELAERLIEILPSNQKRVFYSDNGSTAVEVGIKMALQYWHNQGEQKTKLIAIEGAYHGDTFGAMAVSGRSAFTAPFEKLLFDVEFIPFPKDEKTTLDALGKLLEQEDTAAFVFEPLVQGAAGMRMYSPELLEKMVELCQEHNVLTIADEVMTGFGRTGKMFAVEHIQSQSDIMCLSKGLTGGTMALGATTCSNKVYDAFLSNDKMKTFFHGHSFTANPVACAAACASLDLFEKEQTLQKIANIQEQQQQFLEEIKEHDRIKEVRLQGSVIAIELETGDDTSYFNNIRDKAYQFFMERNLLLRPLGNVLYIFPPFCISKEELKLVYDALKAFLNQKAP